MVAEITVHELGDGVESAVFVEWLKEVGESFAADEAVAEVMTDKVNIEITAEAAGVLTAQECQPEDTVQIGQVIGRYDPTAA